MTTLRTEVSISNGLDWSPDGGTFYFTDSTTRCVDAYDFDVSTGEVSNRRVFVEMADSAATPDGLTVDADGNIWVAMWEGGCVREYSAQGRSLIRHRAARVAAHQRGIRWPPPRPAVHHLSAWRHR